MTAEPAVDGGLEASSLVELAVRRLRTEILSGALVPGGRLVEEQLTRRFDTSRAPLREALLHGNQPAPRGRGRLLPARGGAATHRRPCDTGDLDAVLAELTRHGARTDLAPSSTPEPRA